MSYLGANRKRDGTLSSDKAEVPDKVMWSVKGTTEKNGEGSMHTVTKIGTQGMQGWCHD